jgi:hypothetical protein
MNEIPLGRERMDRRGRLSYPVPLWLSSQTDQPAARPGPTRPGPAWPDAGWGIVGEWGAWHNRQETPVLLHTPALSHSLLNRYHSTA